MNANQNPFSTQIRVRYAETDKLGIAYNSHYLTWFEVGRCELLRNFGLTYMGLEHSGYHFPLNEAGIKYLKPALYDDVLTIVSTLSKKPGVRVRIEYDVRKNGETIATGFTEHAFTDDNLNPVRPPKEIRKKMLRIWELTQELHEEGKKRSTD